MLILLCKICIVFYTFLHILVHHWYIECWVIYSCTHIVKNKLYMWWIHPLIFISFLLCSSFLLWKWYMILKSSFIYIRSSTYQLSIFFMSWYQIVLNDELCIYLWVGVSFLIVNDVYIWFSTEHCSIFQSDGIIYINHIYGVLGNQNSFLVFMENSRLKFQTL